MNRELVLYDIRRLLALESEERTEKARLLLEELEDRPDTGQLAQFRLLAEVWGLPRLKGDPAVAELVLAAMADMPRRETLEEALRLFEGASGDTAEMAAVTIRRLLADEVEGARDAHHALCYVASSLLRAARGGVAGMGSEERERALELLAELLHCLL